MIMPVWGTSPSDWGQQVEGVPGGGDGGRGAGKSPIG